LKNNFIVPNINLRSNTVSKKMNKQELNKLAEDQGFLVPKGCTISLNDLNNVQYYMDKFEVNLPCIIKPLQSVDGVKKDMTIINTNKELLVDLKKIKNTYNKVFIQEFIEKDTEFGIQGVATINGNEIIIPGVIEKIRESKVSRGSTTY